MPSAETIWPRHLKSLEYLLQQAEMILGRLGENDDVVQVYNHAIEMKVCQHFLRQSLKGRRNIPQAKCHSIAFIEA